jgi:hypothetical protein
MAEMTHIRLFCEGKKTEPNYFNDYFKAKGFHQPNMASKPKDHSPKGVAKEAYLHAKKVLKIPEAIDLLRGTPIGVAFSNICFEYWILLHYENTSRAFHNCDEVINYIHQNHDADYGKANDHYARLKHRMPNAIRHAQRLASNQRLHATRPDSILTGSNDHNRPDSPNWTINPYTDVHLIFESLLAKGFVTTF